MGQVLYSVAVLLFVIPRERANPKLIDTSRRRRIARGAGVDPADVSQSAKASHSGLSDSYGPSRQSTGRKPQPYTQLRGTSEVMSETGKPRLACPAGAPEISPAIHRWVWVNSAAPKSRRDD